MSCLYIMEFVRSLQRHLEQFSNIFLPPIFVFWKKKNMDFFGLQEEARAYYNNSAPRVRQSVYQFFLSMAINGDGGVDFYEVQDFLQGLTFQSRYLDGETFNALDQDQDGVLGFYDFITLFYMFFICFYFQWRWCTFKGAVTPYVCYLLHITQ